MGLDADRVSISPQLDLRDTQLEHIGWALVAELEADGPPGSLYADSLGLALVAHLLHRYAPVVPRRIVRGLSKRRFAACARLHSCIHEHLGQDLTLAGLAEIVNLSPSHFKALFKQSMASRCINMSYVCA